MNEFRLSAREQEEIEEFLEHRVIVRVWTSSANPVKPGRGVGYVSIQTRNNYISLWPAQSPAISDDGKIFPHAFLSHYMEDYYREGKQKPQYTFCFYSLNSNDIDSAFTAIQESLVGWTMVPFGRKTQGAESCATLGWKMLEEGNISHLVSNTSRSMIGLAGGSHGSGLASQGSSQSTSHTFSSHREKFEEDLQKIRRGIRYSKEMIFGTLVESPDSAAAALVKAKQEELAKYPLTEKIKKFPNETNVMETKGYCCVM